MTLPDTLPATRDAWHRLAEHVLSAARHAATGRIGLLPAPGGFATPAFGPDARVLAVDLDEFVVTRNGQQQRTRITTVAQVADFAGIIPGAPEQVYRPATALEPDTLLRIDRQAARLLADWYQLGAQSLAAFASAVVDDEPSSAQLWPEHFDLGVTESPPRGSTTASRQATYTSRSPICTSVRSTARRQVTTSGTPRSGRSCATTKWPRSRRPSISSTPGAIVPTQPQIPHQHRGADHEGTRRQTCPRHRRQLRYRSGHRRPAR